MTPATSQMEKAIHVVPGMVTIRTTLRRMPVTGITGPPGTVKSLGRSGRVRRSTSTETFTSAKATSVPRLIAAASSPSGTRAAKRARNPASDQVATTGVLRFADTLPSGLGSKPSLLMV